MQQIRREWWWGLSHQCLSAKILPHSKLTHAADTKGMVVGAIPPMFEYKKVTMQQIGPHGELTLAQRKVVGSTSSMFKCNRSPRSKLTYAVKKSRVNRHPTCIKILFSENCQICTSVKISCVNMKDTTKIRCIL